MSRLRRTRVPPLSSLLLYPLSNGNIFCPPKWKTENNMKCSTVISETSFDIFLLLQLPRIIWPWACTLKTAGELKQGTAAWTEDNKSTARNMPRRRSIGTAARERPPSSIRSSPRPAAGVAAPPVASPVTAREATDTPRTRKPSPRRPSAPAPATSPWPNLPSRPIPSCPATTCTRACVD